MITDFLRLTLPNSPGKAPDRLIAINPEHIAAIQDGPGGTTVITLSCGDEELVVREALLVVLNMIDRRTR